MVEKALPHVVIVDRDGPRPDMLARLRRREPELRCWEVTRPRMIDVQGIDRVDRAGAVHGGAPDCYRQGETMP